MYWVRFGTGEGDFWEDGLEEAMRAADDAACYTQKDIVVEDEDGREVARRMWCDLGFDERECPDEDPICFGDAGYYGDWELDR